MNKKLLYIFKARSIACLFLCLSCNLSAKVLKDEVSLVGETKFNFQEVCLDQTKRAAELIEVHSISTLDCMGTKVLASKFCYKKMAHDPYYIRGVVDKEDKKVICKSAKKVILKYECKKGESLCKDAEIGCFNLQEKLAARLRLAHSSVVDKKILNCYFSPKDDSFLKIAD